MKEATAVRSSRGRPSLPRQSLGFARNRSGRVEQLQVLSKMSGIDDFQNFEGISLSLKPLQLDLSYLQLWIQRLNAESRQKTFGREMILAGSEKEPSLSHSS